MKTKKNMIFIVLGLACMTGFTQVKSNKAKIDWGQEQKTSKRITLDDLVGYDDNGIYAIKTKSSSDYYIEHYDKNLNLSKSVELELKKGKEKRDFEFIVQLEENLLLFTSQLQKKEDKNFLYAQTINKKTLLPNNDLKQVSVINYEGNSNKNSGSFGYSVAKDSSKLLIYYSLPYKKKENEEFGFHVLDKNLNVIWEENVILPYEDGLFSVEEYTLDNKGNVFLLGMAYKDKRVSKRKGQPNYSYQILSYFDNGKTFKTYSVELPEKFITDLQVVINEEGDIICGGFYSDEGTYSIKGSCFMKIDGRTQQVKYRKTKEFDLDFLTQNMSEKEAKKTKKKKDKGKDVEMFEYDLREILLKDDGGAVLIGEQFYITTHTYTDANGNTHSTTYYTYNDIIAINVSPEGDIVWATKIPKRQTTSNDGGFYSSYTMAAVKDKIYFVFNDNPKNLFYKGGKGKLYNFTKSKNSLITLVTLDQNGTQEREALFSTSDADILTRPKVCEQVGKSELILFGQRKKIHKFAKLTFQ